MQHPVQHSLARGVLVGAAPLSSSFRRVGAFAGCLLAMMSGGCSLSFPIASMKPGADDVTASIKPVLGKLADDEDRRRAGAALSTAVDPQGDGRSVHWENPTTHNKGSFVAVGNAYPADARVCRAFLGTVLQNGDDLSFQGTACTVSAGTWAITETKPFKKA